MQMLNGAVGLKALVLMQRENEDVSAMMRVLVGVEMLRCNRNPRQMEFTVPSLSNVGVPF